jgi:hypothetical protein
MKRVFYIQKESKQRLGTQVSLNLLHIQLLTKSLFSVFKLSSRLKPTQSKFKPNFNITYMTLCPVSAYMGEQQIFFTAIMVMFAMVEE